MLWTDSSVGHPACDMPVTATDKYGASVEQANTEEDQSIRRKELSQYKHRLNKLNTVEDICIRRKGLPQYKHRLKKLSTGEDRCIRRKGLSQYKHRLNKLNTGETCIRRKWLPQYKNRLKKLSTGEDVFGDRPVPVQMYHVTDSVIESEPSSWGSYMVYNYGDASAFFKRTREQGDVTRKKTIARVTVVGSCPCAYIQC
jgi:hypothetical protein